MNEEEKKAILIIKKYIDNLEEDKQFFTTTKDNIITIYNLVKKQQKEIEELEILLKEKSKGISFMLLNYISKYRVEEKIEEYEEILDSPIIKEDYKLEVQHIIGVLKELRGE